MRQILISDLSGLVFQYHWPISLVHESRSQKRKLKQKVGLIGKKIYRKKKRRLKLKKRKENHQSASSETADFVWKKIKIMYMGFEFMTFVSFSWHLKPLFIYLRLIDQYSFVAGFPGLFKVLPKCFQDTQKQLSRFTSAETKTVREWRLL